MKTFNLLILFILVFGSVNAQLNSTNLPIFIIDTKSQTIVNEPKLLVNLKVIYNGEGKLNNLNDKTFHYDNAAGIELRGSSSQSFPKKPYGFELRNQKGEENPFALCGFPIESDFILFASYNEKSLLQNVLTMDLAQKFNLYGSRTKYVELIINENYEGIYVLMEKIKVDKGRVDIAKLKTTDINGDELTGGYIIKVDKSTGTGFGSFRSNYPRTSGNATTYFYDAPKTINETQKTYIKNYVRKFEDAIYTVSFKDSVNGYRKFINVGSFAKMFILNEVSRNVDGYRISSYFHKDKDSKGGKLTAGPPWDYDIAYGNADYCQGNRYDLWGYRFNDICPSDGFQVPEFWTFMVKDPYFIGELRTAYFQARKTGGILDLDVLYKEIDTKVNFMGDAVARNFNKWQILGKYVWPNPQPIPSDYNGEIRELKTWLKNRLEWLDVNMPKELIITATEPNKPTMTLKLFPNPFVDKFHVNIQSETKETVSIKMADITGKVFLEKNMDLQIGDNDLDIENFSNPNQLFFLSLKTKNGIYTTQKILKAN